MANFFDDPPTTKTTPTKASTSNFFDDAPPVTKATIAPKKAPSVQSKPQEGPAPKGFGQAIKDAASNVVGGFAHGLDDETTQGLQQALNVRPGNPLNTVNNAVIGVADAGARVMGGAGALWNGATDLAARGIEGGAHAIGIPTRNSTREGDVGDIQDFLNVGSIPAGAHSPTPAIRTPVPAVPLGDAVTKGVVSGRGLNAAVAAAQAAKVTKNALAATGAKISEGVAKVASGPEARSIAKALQNDPNAAQRATIVSKMADAANATTDIGNNGKALTKPGRSPITAIQLNTLERSFSQDFPKYIKATVADPEEADRLTHALQNSLVMTKGDIDALRGTTAGDAVADAITNRQLLRGMSKEVPETGVRATLAKLAPHVASGVGAVVGHSLGGLEGGVIGVTAGASSGTSIAKRISKSFLTPANMEAARVHDAARYIAKADKYQKLGDYAGTDPSILSTQALKDAYYETEAGKAELGAQKAASSAKTSQVDQAWKRNAPSTAMLPPAAKSKTRGLQAYETAKAQAERDKAAQMDAMWKQKPSDPPLAANVPLDAQEKVDLATVSRLNNAPAQASAQRLAFDNTVVPLDQTLGRISKKNGGNVDLEAVREASKPKPPKPPKPRGLNAAQQAIADNIANGIKGPGSGLNYIADWHAYAPADKVADALEALRPQYPRFSHEFDAVLGGYKAPKAMAEVVGPALRKYLGTEDKFKRARATPAEAEAKPMASTAPETVSQEVPLQAAPAEPKPAPEAVDPLQGEPDTGQTYKRIEHVANYNASRAERIQMADDAIKDFHEDIRIPDEARPYLKDIGRKIKLDFKSTEEANAHIEQFMHDLPAGLLDGGEEATVRNHLFRIADTKPHKTLASFKAGALKGKRGRPTKN